MTTNERTWAALGSSETRYRSSARKRENRVGAGLSTPWSWHSTVAGGRAIQFRVGGLHSLVVSRKGSRSRPRDGITASRLRLCDADWRTPPEGLSTERFAHASSTKIENGNPRRRQSKVKAFALRNDLDDCPSSLRASAAARREDRHKSGLF